MPCPPRSRLRLLLLAMLIGCAGCGSLSPRRVGQRKIAGYLQNVVGPADEYRVRILRDGDTDLFGGRIGHLRVEGTGVRARGGLLLDRIYGDLWGLRFDRRQELLRSVETSDLYALVSGEAATDYVNRRATSLEDVRLELQQNRVKLTARRPLPAGLSVAVELEGSFELDGPRRVNFVTDSVSVAKLSMPRPVVTFVESRINPVFDLDAIQMPLDLRGVRVEPGRAVLRGQLAVPSGGISGRAAKRPRSK